MPIPFHDDKEVEALGAAGYIKIQPDISGSSFAGALFLVNARGEPLEFTYNRIEIPHTFLWKRADIQNHAVRKLVTSLLSICPKVPRLILCLAEEVDSELFCHDIKVSIPVCRVALASKAVSYSSQETKETANSPQSVHLFWFPQRPEDNTLEQQLVHKLSSYGLILEPFERASMGLQEVYRGNNKT